MFYNIIFDVDEECEIFIAITQNSFTMIHILKKLSRYTNRKPIGSRLAFQAKESTNNRYIYLH